MVAYGFFLFSKRCWVCILWKFIKKSFCICIFSVGKYGLNKFNTFSCILHWLVIEGSSHARRLHFKSPVVCARVWWRCWAKGTREATDQMTGAVFNEDINLNRLCIFVKSMSFWGMHRWKRIKVSQTTFLFSSIKIMLCNYV